MREEFIVHQHTESHRVIQPSIDGDKVGHITSNVLWVRPKIGYTPKK